MRGRLVVQRDEDRRGERRIVGLLYPEEADDWSRALHAWRLAAPQPLPPTGVGGVVEVRRRGEGPWSLRPDDRTDDDVPVVDVEVVEDLDPRGPLARQPFAAARGADVVTHPAFDDSLSTYAWDGQPETVDESAHAGFRSWLRAGHTGRRKAAFGVALAVLGLGVVWGMRLLGISERVGTSGRYWAWGAGFAALVAAYRRMTRRVEVGEERDDLDVDRSARRTLTAMLWWAAGHDRPVAPWLTFATPDGEPLSLPMLNVDPELDLPDDGRVTVIGEPAEGAVVLVEVTDPHDGETRLLEPAGELRVLGG